MPSKSWLGTFERGLRARAFMLLALGIVFAMFWPGVATTLLAPRRLFALPHTDMFYEPRTVALGIIVLSASVRCRPLEFFRVLRSPSGLTNLVAVYLAVPLVTLAFAAGLLRFGGEGLQAVAMGLVLVTIMPVAMTSTVWTRAAKGNVALTLSTLTLTSALAVFIIPYVIGRMPGGSGVGTAPIDLVRNQVVLAFAVPLVIGMTLRGVSSRLADKLDALLSIASFAALLVSVADCAGTLLKSPLALRPALLGTALACTIAANALAFGAGWIVARLRGGSNDDAIAILFSSGMRSTPAAMIIAAVALPTAPLATLVPVLWSITQQLIAGALAHRALREREAALFRASSPSLADAAPSLAASPRAALRQSAVDLEQSVVLPLVKRFRDTIADMPYEELFETVVYRPQAKRRSELSAVIARRQIM